MEEQEIAKIVAQELLKKTPADHIENILSYLIGFGAIMCALIFGFNSCQKNEEDQMIKEALREILKERIEAQAVR